MSSLTARHRWCAERILFCFVHNDKENNERFDESKVQSFLRKPKIQEKFDDLFAGEGPAALFVHYQPRHVNELDPLDPTESCDGKLTKKSELFISNGDSTLMNSKCCYFLRQGYQVDSSVANDTSLLYGEFLDSPLETIKTMLSSTYAPLFAQSSEWGETNEEQKADFNDEMNKFMRNLTSAVESISGGLELRGLTSTPIESLNSSNSQNAAPNPEVIVHLEELLGEWCGQIENFIKTREKSTHRQVTSAEDLEGPKGEIEHWRARTQHLSSIVEQLKRKDCRYVVGVLSSYTKGTNDPSKSKTIGLLRRWKQIDIETTEAVNEAKDNLKYLSTLQRFIEPLYSGTAQSIIDTLPALINSIKVSMALGLSFNTADALLSWGISNT